MHLHEALKLWRAEILAPHPVVAWADEDLRDLPEGLVPTLSRDTVPGGLRADEADSVPVHLAPAEHLPERPATPERLEALETALGFELPDAVDLLLRLHDGGDFYRPRLPDLPPRLADPLRLLDTAGIAAAYAGLIAQLRAALREQEPEDDDFFRIARRFGAPKAEATVLADQLRRVARGAARGLEIVPVARARGGDNLICFVPRSGKAGRIGCLFQASGFLPDHSDELTFEGLEGWLEAVVRSHACHRIVSM